MLSPHQLATQERLNKAFTPNRPIDLPEFLAGRRNLLYRAYDAARTAGLHIVLFGERGTGKTSVARVLAYNLQEPDREDGYRAILVSCNSSDDYSTIWKKASQEILLKQRQLGFLQHNAAVVTGRLSLDEPINDPNDARLFVQSLPNPSVIIVDEFDRVPLHNDTRPLMADTIKLFSDNNVQSTIMIVGVAESITELIAEHESVSRNIAQIRVEPMTVPELSEIIQRGFDYAKLAYENQLDHNIAELSQGYPHYTHLLGLWSGRRAIESNRDKVSRIDLDNAIPDALSNTIGSVQQEYEQAITSAKPNALYRDVLLACALAEKDSLGRFSLVDVKAPLRRVTGRDYDSGAYQGHLAKFCEPQRGPVLKRTGRIKNYRWQFVNPQLITYVRLQGVKDGRLSH